jgi:hypothetical protein
MDDEFLDAIDNTVDASFDASAPTNTTVATGHTNSNGDRNTDPVLLNPKPLYAARPSGIEKERGFLDGERKPGGVTPLDDAGRQLGVAQQTLGSQLGNKNNVTAARQATQRADDWLTPDQSSPSPGPAQTAAVNDYRNALDRAIDSLKKHTDQTAADADAVGLGAGALAGYKAEAQLTSAAEAAGITVTSQLSAKFKDMADDARDAATDLAKVQVASDISRGTQTAFLSPQDVQIANQLKGIYGNDIPAALQSSEAAALRVNNAMSSMNSLPVRRLRHSEPIW